MSDTQDREAVERAARAMYEHEPLKRQEPWDDLGGVCESLGEVGKDYWRKKARTALDAAGVPALDAEVERLRADRRAVIAALGPHLRITDDLAGAVTRLALLAEPGGQVGEKCPTCGGDGAVYEQVRVGQASTPFVCQACGGDGDRPAPVVPDSAGVRERVAHGLFVAWRQRHPGSLTWETFGEAQKARFYEQADDALAVLTALGLTVVDGPTEAVDRG